MRLVHHIIALFVFLGWISANAHVMTEHGGGSSTSASIAVHLVNDHDGSPGEDHHEHDLTAPAAKFSNEYKSPAPISVAIVLCDYWLKQLAALLQTCSEDESARICAASSHVDGRTCGWLLVCQTALPVRGPSLVA